MTDQIIQAPCFGRIPPHQERVGYTVVPTTTTKIIKGGSHMIHYFYLHGSSSRMTPQVERIDSVDDRLLCSNNSVDINRVEQWGIFMYFASMDTDFNCCYYQLQLHRHVFACTLYLYCIYIVFIYCLQNNEAAVSQGSAIYGHELHRPPEEIMRGRAWYSELDRTKTKTEHRW